VVVMMEEMTGRIAVSKGAAGGVSEGGGKGGRSGRRCVERFTPSQTRHAEAGDHAC
jgi:molybdenum-dependent DNA-binding transcriptional regulator ModE